MFALSASGADLQDSEETTLAVQLVADQGTAQGLKYTISLVPGGKVEFRYEYSDMTVGYMGDVTGTGLLSDAALRSLLRDFSDQGFFELPQTLTYSSDYSGRYDMKVTTSKRSHAVSVGPAEIESPELMRFWHSWLAIINAVPAQPRMPVP
jgi:hypothetical protein